MTLHAVLQYSTQFHDSLSEKVKELAVVFGGLTGTWNLDLGLLILHSAQTFRHFIARGLSVIMFRHNKKIGLKFLFSQKPFILRNSLKSASKFPLNTTFCISSLAWLMNSWNQSEMLLKLLNKSESSELFGPIRVQYSGHMNCLDWSESRVQYYLLVFLKQILWQLLSQRHHISLDSSENIAI